MKSPAYHRQRFLLYLLESSHGCLARMDMQKLSFLYMQENASQHYSFIPYHYGAYSFQLADDLDLLQKRGWINQDNNRVELIKNISEESWAVKSDERNFIHKWIQSHPQREYDLARLTYKLYPFYASKSRMKDRFLEDSAIKKYKNNCVTDNTNIAVLTIGYEGKHFEEYINTLIRNSISLLCDVRNNPLSRKFGFSSQSLKTILPKINIEYSYYPELGITSHKRQNLQNEDDYKKLFTHYSNALNTKKEFLNQLQSDIEKHRRVALTCFEANHLFCHRQCISAWLEKQYNYPIIHL